MKLVTPPMTAKTNPSDRRGTAALLGRAGAVRQPRSALAVCLILGSGVTLGTAVACGGDEAAVIAGANPAGNAVGRGSSGGATKAGTGGGNASLSGAGAGGGSVAASGNGGESSTGAAGADGAAGAAGNAPEEFFSGIAESCGTGDSSEPCTWSLVPELAGATCTPGEQLILGCCDCGSSPRSMKPDPFLRVCDGSMSCSDSAAIGFADDGCQYCPVLEFTCPASGVYSALVGSYPVGETDADGNFTQGAAPPSSCQPKLIDASDLGVKGDAGTLSFDDIHPLLVTNCGRCHAEDTGLGSLLGLPPFASSDIEVAFGAAVDYGVAILGQVNAGVMPPDTCNGPPGSTGCVSVEGFDRLRKWFAAGTPR